MICSGCKKTITELTGYVRLVEMPYYDNVLCAECIAKKVDLNTSIYKTKPV